MFALHRQVSKKKKPTNVLGNAEYKVTSLRVCESIECTSIPRVKQLSLESRGAFGFMIDTSCTVKVFSKSVRFPMLRRSKLF